MTLLIKLFIERKKKEEDNSMTTLNLEVHLLDERINLYLWQYTSSKFMEDL
jgi:hypothetical protein